MINVKVSLSEWGDTINLSKRSDEKKKIEWHFTEIKNTRIRILSMLKSIPSYRILILLIHNKWNGFFECIYFEHSKISFMYVFHHSLYVFSLCMLFRFTSTIKREYTILHIKHFPPSLHTLSKIIVDKKCMNTSYKKIMILWMWFLHLLFFNRIIFKKDRWKSLDGPRRTVMDGWWTSKDGDGWLMDVERRRISPLKKILILFLLQLQQKKHYAYFIYELTVFKLSINALIIMNLERIIALKQKQHDQIMD